MRDSFSKIAADRRAAFAAQVRTSTGFTWRRAGVVVVVPARDDGGRDRAPVVRREIVPASVDRWESGPARMMRVLASWPVDRPLARTQELAEIVGVVQPHMTPTTVSARVTAMLNAAQQRGLIEVFAQANGPHRRERAVLVRAPGAEGGGRVLATEAAPAVWVADLRRRAAASLVGGE